jgi:hypothetical protein
MPASATKEWKDLPKFDDLPDFKNFKGCAWSVWGEDDELGTVNLLTEDVVRRAAQEEIKYVSIGALTKLRTPWKLIPRHLGL